MEKHETVLATLGLWKEIAGTLIQAIPSTLTPGGMREIISKKKMLIKKVRHILMELAGDKGHNEILAEWARFYLEVFGIETDFSDLEIPEKVKGFNWLIVVYQGLTRNGLFEKCRERFGGKVWKYYNNLDKEIVEAPRKTDHTYAIWVRDCVEADEANKGKSFEVCQQEGMNIITLEERFVLELWYEWEYKKHLDIKNSTLTSSRDSDGDVVVVYWHDVHDKLFVLRYGPRYAHDILRARSAVS